jgi:hypothetical protein
MSQYLTLKCQKFTIESNGINYDYLLGAENPKLLKSVSDAPSFKDNTPNSEIASEVLVPPTKHWQRPLIQKKVDAIASRFDQAAEIMPNPVLLAVNPSAVIDVKKEINAGGAETGLWIIKIPIPEDDSLQKPLWIIDGQHRMSGLAKTKTDHKTLPFVLLYSEHGVYLPSVLAKVFAQVTTEATPLQEIHKAWMQFVFELGDYQKDSEDWRAMKSTAILCTTQSFDNKPNPFYDKIQFNPELSSSPIVPGGFAYDAKSLQELFRDKFFRWSGGEFASISEMEFAEEIAKAMIALKTVVKGDPAETAFFGESSYEQKYFRDGFIAGVCSYMYEYGKPARWTKVLNDLNFQNTDWDITSWVDSTGGTAGTTSKRIAFNCFEEIFEAASLPDGVETICTYLQGQNAALDVEFQSVDDSGTLIKNSKQTKSVELVSGVARLQVKVPKETRYIKITSKCNNIGAVTLSRADKPFDSNYNFQSFKKGKEFKVAEIKSFKNKLQLNVKVDLYGNNSSEKTLVISFDE